MQVRQSNSGAMTGPWTASLDYTPYARNRDREARKLRRSGDGSFSVSELLVLVPVGFNSATHNAQISDISPADLLAFDCLQTMLLATTKAGSVMQKHHSADLEWAKRLDQVQRFVEGQLDQSPVAIAGPEDIPIFPVLHLNLEAVLVTVQSSILAIVLDFHQGDAVAAGSALDAYGEVREEPRASRQHHTRGPKFVLRVVT